MRIDLRRLDGWRSRLADELARQRHDPFAWGDHDCATGFAARIIEAITGEDLAAEFRGKYRSPVGALRLLKRAGVDSLGDFAALHLPEVEPAFARVGDIGIVPSDNAVKQGFCMIDASNLLVLTEAGHGHSPRSDLIRAFRVGD